MFCSKDYVTTKGTGCPTYQMRFYVAILYVIMSLRTLKIKHIFTVVYLYDLHVRRGGRGGGAGGGERSGGPFPLSHAVQVYINLSTRR